MKVTFTRTGERQYSISIDREHGPALLPRPAPGYDDYLPHDLAHYVIEEQFAIMLGVFGQLAAGGGGIFTPVPSERTGRVQRSARRIALAGRSDMHRSEKLVGLCVAEWERRKGHRTALPPEVDTDVATPAEVDQAVIRLDDVATRWHALQRGASLTFTWPMGLTFNAASSRRGRQDNRRANSDSARKQRQARRAGRQAFKG